VILADIASNTGTDLRDRIVLEERFAIDDFASRYNSYEGRRWDWPHAPPDLSLSAATPLQGGRRPLLRGRRHHARNRRADNVLSAAN